MEFWESPEQVPPKDGDPSRLVDCWYVRVPPAAMSPRIHGIFHGGEGISQLYFPPRPDHRAGKISRGENFRENRSPQVEANYARETG